MVLNPEKNYSKLLKSYDSSQVNYKDLYNADNFKEMGYKIVDLLATHLDRTKTKQNKTVLPSISPDRMEKIWSKEFKPEPIDDFESIISRVISLSNNLHHPNYVGHQATGPLPQAALCDLVSSFLNNTSAVYEMGPVATIMEKHVINWLAKQVGYDDNADGIFTSGGTLGNLTCLLAARQAKAGFDVWERGLCEASQLAVLISEQAHYSCGRAIQLMGLGREGVILVPSDDNYCMDNDILEVKYNEALKEGKKVIAVVGNACSTATGSYDSLEKIADFCEKYDLWFHVDGAHGASATLSDKYSHLLKGIERADSIIWDAHKMMLMPALLTACIFKDGDTSYEAYHQQASYVFEKSAREEWYNLCHRTMECTKTMMVLKLYTCLSALGTQVFSDYVTDAYDLARQFATMLDESPDFEIATWPQANIICFRFTGSDQSDLNNLQKEIRRKIHESELFYITQAELRGQAYLRCTFINPHTTQNELENLINLIRELAC